MKWCIPGRRRYPSWLPSRETLLNAAMGMCVLISIQGGSSRHLSRLELGLAVGVPLLFLLALLLATLVGLLYLKPRLARYREQKRQRAAADKCSESPSLKSGAAPGLGPDTTLVLTDVQNSTTLFEILPTEVMDRAMRLHDECFRRNLTMHRVSLKGGISMERTNPAGWWVYAGEAMWEVSPSLKREGFSSVPILLPLFLTFPPLI
jgi:hypothetical protein